MAGKKETPRQRMIGMMYLVLTALLALNVSNVVIEKFIFINATLEGLVEEEVSRNSKTFNNISQSVKDKGNRAADVKALNRAEEVHKITSALMKEMDDLKDEMIRITGGEDNETGKMKGAQDIDKVGSLMMGTPRGSEFEKILDEYVSQLNQLTGLEFEQLTRDAREIPIFANDPDQKNKNFLALTFGETPAAAGVASVSQLQAEVLEYESSALNRIAEDVGAKDVEFDKIVPMVRPTSRVVAAGAKYEADMFITASATGINPVMAYNGKKIKVVDDPTGVKMGKVEFTARGGNYDRKTNMSKQSFKAQITLNDSTYEQEIEYFVVKPVVQVRSAALQALYANCNNELDIQVPSLGTSYNPSFRSAEATIIKGNKTGLVTVIPKGRSKVKLAVRNDGQTLDVVTFDVKRIPPPSYEIKSRGKEINLKHGLSVAQLSTMSVKAIPEENFAREVPKDAKYRIRKMTVTLARGPRPIQTKEFTTENLDLRQWRSSAKSGDRIVIEIDRVMRRPPQGEERVPTRNVIFNVPIN